MIVRYDSLNRFEKPIFTLCQPGSTYVDGCLTKTIGALIDHEAEEIVFNFNALSELNMRVNLVPRDDTDENEYVYGVFRAIKNRRLIYAESIGYFVITNVSDGYDGNVSYKDITAKSVDAELQQKMIPYIEDGTYRFSTDSAKESKGIFETIVETLPLWTIGHVDESIASRWRTFEDVDTSLNCFAFLIDKVQEAYECIIVFDIIHRVINAYARDNYVRQTDIHITKQDLINSIDIDENADDIYTAISALGGDSVSIAAVNPLGTNVIYAFDYYLSWMSDALRKKVAAWQSAVDAAFNEHYQLSQEYYQQLELATNLEQDIAKINAQITMYGRCRDNIVAQSSTDIVKQYNPVIEGNGGDAISVDKEIDATLQEIDKLIGECNKSLSDVQTRLNTANKTLTTKESAIDKIHNELSILNYFTEEEYTELCLYIYEGSYSDEYVVVTESMSYVEKFEQMKLLYDRAKSQLDKVSVPTQEFNIDVESFIFIKDFAEWSEQLETGCLINVELDINDIAAIFLASITVNYDDHSMKLTFGNRYNKFDPKSLFDNMLGNISKSANTLNYIKETIYPIKSGEFSAIREVLQTSRDLTMNAALAATSEEVVIDASGYTGKRLLSNGEYDDRQIKIVNNSIVFTNDGWNSCSTALGEIILDDNTSIYGVNARVIFGDMIIGGGLKIYDKNGNEMLSVVDGISARVEDIEGNYSTLEQTVNGFDTRVGNAEGKVSEFEQTVNGFTLSVSNGDESSTLSLKSGNTTLSSAEIEIKGFVKFTDLENSGATTINGSNITTGTISADRIDADSLQVKGANVSGALTAAEISASKITAGTSDAAITFDGAFTAPNATITGNITATSGEIGGCKISNKKLQIDGGNITTGTIAAGRIDADNLKVNAANVSGTLTAAEISATKITAGTNSAKITFNGAFTAPSANITGKITASSGQIGDWSIIPDSAGCLLGSAQQIGNNWYGIALDPRKNALSNGASRVFAIGRLGSGGESSAEAAIKGAWENSAFHVTTDGTVYANKLNADGGMIGGWAISSSYLSASDTRLSSSGVGIKTSSDTYTFCPWPYIYNSGWHWHNTTGQSDRNVKNSISDIDDYDVVFDNLKPCRYKYNHGTSDRYHTGFIAQEVVSAVESAGLTTQDFAAVIHLEQPDENGCEWLLRRDEFVALNTWQIQKLKKRVAELEAKLESL